MFRRFYLDDPFNKNSDRNILNTPRNTYNCGGYALGTFSWYCPHEPSDEDSWGQCDYGFRNSDEAWVKTMYAVSKMILDFEGNLRMVKSLDDVRKSERVVAFRLSSDGDFHYVKRSFNGCWYHKRGASPKIERMTKDEVLNHNWCVYYDGPVVLLAIKK